MNQNIDPVRVRFAPSPTGHVHLGSARTALYDYLIARKTNGEFILRIEDTDRKRLVEGAEEELIKGLRWLGIDWDEGPIKGGDFCPYRQSERKEIYLKYAKELVDKGAAYYCFCSKERLQEVRQRMQREKITPRYDGLCRDLPFDTVSDRIERGDPYVIRFKTPKEGVTIVNDLLRGEIRTENKTLDDYVIVKSDGWALYHLASIVDDHLMKITHVIRGAEWIPTFPLHHLIWKAFGWNEPTWIHLSVFLKPSGKGKMSKREVTKLNSDGYSIFIKDFQNLGYLPEAVINWIALMGWSYDDHTEFFSMDDLVEKFTLEKLNPSPAAINFSKLDHFNRMHIRNLADRDLAQRMIPFFRDKSINASIDKLELIVPLLKERITTLDDSVAFCRFLFIENISLNIDQLIIEDITLEKTIDICISVINIIESISEWKVKKLGDEIKTFMAKEQLSPKQLLGFLREAISGQRVTPPIFDCMIVLGKETSVHRLNLARIILEEMKN
jgi:glutamyl-tRNA synthetase